MRFYDSKARKYYDYTDEEKKIYQTYCYQNGLYGQSSYADPLGCFMENPAKRDMEIRLSIDDLTMEECY